MNCDSKTYETRILDNEKVKNKKKMIKSKKYLKQNMNRANSKEEDIEFNERLVSIISNINVDDNIYNVYSKVLHVIKDSDLKYHYKESNAKHNFYIFF